jgi:hypothetical protein
MEIPVSASEAVTGVVMKMAALSKLQWVTGVYGLLYVAFEVLATIPFTRSLIIEPNQSMGLALSLTQLLCLLFLLGYAASWSSELIAGAVIVLWFAFVCWMEAFSIRFGPGNGMATVLCLPGLILGILFLVSWFVSWFKRRAVRGAGV